MAAELVRSVYWFNPLLWIACGRLRQESEYACDDAVLNLGVEGTEYATHLLDVARTFRRHGRTLSGSPALAIARPSTLEKRVRAMLNNRLNRSPIRRIDCRRDRVAGRRRADRRTGAGVRVARRRSPDR
jgi:beta-lactamase regulating signal transducer with metallopeptidase domain